MSFSHLSEFALKRLYQLIVTFHKLLLKQNRSRTVPYILWEWFKKKCKKSFYAAVCVCELENQKALCERLSILCRTTHVHGKRKMFLYFCFSLFSRCGMERRKQNLDRIAAAVVLTTILLANTTIRHQIHNKLFINIWRLTVICLYICII